MEGIRLTGTSLFSKDKMEDVQNQAHSILASKGLEVKNYKGIVSADSFLNSVEVTLNKHEDGTLINVDFGMTTIGVLLTVIFLVFGAVIGIILILLWYLKMDEIKSAFRNAYPGYVPPPPRGESYGPSSGPTTQEQNKQINDE